MQNSKLQFKIKNLLNFKKPLNSWMILALVLAVFLLLSLIGNALLLLKVDEKLPINHLSSSINSSLSSDNPSPVSEEPSLIESVIEPVSAKEIYPLFECSCCGQPINECSCGMAEERRDYLDSLVETKITKEEIVLAYIKNYGLDSFVDKELQKEFREKLIKEAPTERPIISIAADYYDLGDVSQKKGIKETFFEIKNEGESDLIINKLKTSCGCTSASIVFQNEEGPKFNMPGHGINEEIKDWQVILGPGEKAQLKVYYDPNVHLDFRGAAIREIYVFSNDPIDFEKKVSIELNQVP